MSIIAGREGILLQTRLGWNIPNNLSPERAEVSLKAAVEIQRDLHPDAILRSISATYNCAGMVVACRRVHTNTDDVEKVLADDGFRKLAAAEVPEIGDVVLYRNDGNVDHVGIVARIDIDFENAARKLFVLSKWGDDGEYVHAIDDIPDGLGAPSDIWTERRCPK